MRFNSGGLDVAVVGNCRRSATATPNALFKSRFLGGSHRPDWLPPFSGCGGSFFQIALRVAPSVKARTGTRNAQRPNIC